MTQTRLLEEAHMKVYIAATYEDKPQARRFAADLISMGHEVTSEWITNELDNEGIVDGQIPANSGYFAETDKRDIARSDVMVYLTGERDSPGKSFEAGYAHATGLLIYPVGDREPATIFRTLWFPTVTVDEFLLNPFPEGQ